MLSHYSLNILSIAACLSIPATAFNSAIKSSDTTGGKGNLCSKEYFWKMDLIEVMDGGNDHFHLIINLDKLIFYNVIINAYG